VKAPIPGQKLGRLTPMERVKRGAKWRWRCQCDCGAVTEVCGWNLVNGLTRSCGCLRRDVARVTGFGRLTGTGRSAKIHGLELDEGLE
jgi:hypothetical protein